MKYADDIHNPTESWEFFQKELLEYLDEYQSFLLQENKWTQTTINKRYGTLYRFIEFVCGYRPVTGFEDISYTMCSSGFSGYVKSQGDDEIPASLSRKYIRDFFIFIQQRHGIANRKLLGKLIAAK